MLNRKQTAWKKNRKFGDIHGGRDHKKWADRIIYRAHSLYKPGDEEELPILMEDNPSKDYYFPLSIKESLEALDALPKNDTMGITHLWHRRFKKTEYEKGDVPFAEFSCGSGVRLIILYPWPINNILDFGKKKPSERAQRRYSRWTTDLFKEEGSWRLKWEPDKLKQFYVEYLLYFEVGQHVDWYYREWSKANTKKVQEFAYQYAMQCRQTATYVFNGLENLSQD